MLAWHCIYYMVAERVELLTVDYVSIVIPSLIMYSRIFCCKLCMLFVCVRVLVLQGLYAIHLFNAFRYGECTKKGRIRTAISAYIVTYSTRSSTE